MVERIGDGFRVLFQGDEIEDVLVRIQFSVHLDGHAVIVTMQPFAILAVVGDEMAGAEDQIVLGDADGVSLGGHGLIGRLGGAGRGNGNWMIFCRSAKQKLAVTRSAVVPGLRGFPPLPKNQMCSFANSRESSLWNGGGPKLRARRETSFALSWPNFLAMRLSGYFAKSMRCKRMIAVVTSAFGAASSSFKMLAPSKTCSKSLTY